MFNQPALAFEEILSYFLSSLNHPETSCNVSSSVLARITEAQVFSTEVSIQCFEKDNASNNVAKMDRGFSLKKVKQVGHQKVRLFAILSLQHQLHNCAGAESLSKSTSNIKSEGDLHHCNGSKVFHKIFAFHVKLSILWHALFTIGFFDLLPVKKFAKSRDLVVALVCHPVSPVMVGPFPFPFKPTPRISKFNQMNFLIIFQNGMDTKDGICMMTHKSQFFFVLWGRCARNHHHSFRFDPHPT